MNGGPNLKAWRRGNRDEWPAPDASPLHSGQQSPFGSRRSTTLLEAWELSRPWFVDPNAGKFAMNAVHPEHWFQGEYILFIDGMAVSKLLI